jgi:hypothetical protein
MNDQPAQGNPLPGNNPPANNPPANNPPANNPPTVALIRTKEYTAVNRLPERSHLTDNNWYDWKEWMNRVFTSCDITGYIDGTIQRVVPEHDVIGARNWVKNDTWAQQIIMDNVSATQMNHIRSKRTAHAMYEGLASTHEDMVFYTVNNIENLLQTAKATDADDLLKHLDNLKGLHDRMNEFPNPNFHLLDVRFKTIISNSLPRSWRSFVEPYMGNAKNANDPDPKCRTQSDTFIGILREEYKIQKNNEKRDNGINGEGSYQTNGPQANIANTQINPKTLGSRISGQTNPCAWCDIWEMKGHWTSKCYKNAIIAAARDIWRETVRGRMVAGRERVRRRDIRKGRSGKERRNKKRRWKRQI